MESTRNEPLIEKHIVNTCRYVHVTFVKSYIHAYKVSYLELTEECNIVPMNWIYNSDLLCCSVRVLIFFRVGFSTENIFSVAVG